MEKDELYKVLRLLDELLPIAVKPTPSGSGSTADFTSVRSPTVTSGRRSS